MELSDEVHGFFKWWTVSAIHWIVEKGPRNILIKGEAGQCRYCRN
jgi:hypothetical protein